MIKPFAVKTYLKKYEKTVCLLEHDMIFLAAIFLNNNKTYVWDYVKMRQEIVNQKPIKILN